MKEESPSSGLRSLTGDGDEIEDTGEEHIWGETINALGMRI